MDTVQDADADDTPGPALLGGVSDAVQRRLQALEPGHERDTAGLALLGLLGHHHT